MSVRSGKSIKKNYIFNASYQLLIILTPLITAPYLSSTIGPDGVGAYSFAESIVSYFVITAALGMATFGQREVSYVRDDIKKRSKVFWETKTLEVITGLIVSLIYIPFALTRENQVLYLVLVLEILAVVANTAWFLQGIEEFGRIVFVNAIFRVANIVYIFTFVRSKDDVAVYAFGTAFFLLSGNISQWFMLSKYIEKPHIQEIHPFRNIIPILTLFVPTVAIQVYTVMDKTMIGVITGSDFENGYYEQAMKITKAVLAVVTSLGAVMASRIGTHYAKGESEKVSELMYKAYNFVWFMGIPLCFGLLGTASCFVPWFFGEDFQKVVPLLCILGFIILAIGISNVTGIQYLIPTNRQNMFTLSVVIGAVVNFCLNMILIRFFASIGAAVASVVAETLITVVQIFLVRKELSPKKIIMCARHYVVAGGLMLMVLRVMSTKLEPRVTDTIIMIIVGAIIYFGSLLVMRDSFLLSNIKPILAKIKKTL